MAGIVKRIEEAVLELPRDERIALTLRLLDSIEGLDHLPTLSTDECVTEASRRYDAYLRGEDVAIPVEEIFPDWKDDAH